jgi:hypothetical protein
LPKTPIEQQLHLAKLNPTADHFAVGPGSSFAFATVDERERVPLTLCLHPKFGRILRQRVGFPKSPAVSTWSVTRLRSGEAVDGTAKGPPTTSAPA